MNNLTNKVKTFYGWDIYELTEEEGKEFSHLPRPGDPEFRASYYPDKTFYIFEEGENLATALPVLVTRSLPSATSYCRWHPRNPSANKHLTVEDLKNLPLHEWVWIEVLKPFDFKEKVSAYYRKYDDISHARAFCCGYPGLTFSFDYADYDETWTAYLYQPKEQEV